VVLVIWFFNSSSVNPMASLAAILAIGYPVAFEASAEERDARGWPAAALSSSVAWFWAN